MQQTEKYKLNLIESSDPFLPDSLNQNTRKLEDMVGGALDSMQGAVSAISKSLGTGGKTARVAWGTFTPTGAGTKNNPYRLTFDFCPLMVMYNSAFEEPDNLPINAMTVMIRGVYSAVPAEPGFVAQVRWLDNAVEWWYLSSSYSLRASDGISVPDPNSSTAYFIIGYDRNS